MTPAEESGAGRGATADAPVESESPDVTLTVNDRGDRGVGIRERVLVLPSVICSREVANRIADRAPGAVSAPHDHGCGQIGVDEAQTRRAFLGVGSNPNVAGTVVVGLGCETIQSDDVADALADRGVPVREVAIQDAGGTGACVDAGVAAVEALRSAGRQYEGGSDPGTESQSGDSADTRTVELSDLTVGVVSGDLTESTRHVADRLVGEFVDDLVAAGGRVVVAGTERVLAHPDEARTAAATASVAAGIDDLVDARAGQPARAAQVGRAAARLEFSATTRFWGDQPVRDVLAYGERATHGDGVAIVDAPSRFAEAATGLAAAGAQLVVHVTGEGVPTGHPVVPVCKVSADRETLAAVGSDIDVDATEATVEDLRSTVRNAAGGEPTKAEAHGLEQLALTRIGPSM